MTSDKQRQPARRRIPRPKRVELCPHCNSVLGLNYLDCPSCHQAIESIWEADWNDLLAREQILAGADDEALLAQLVIAELDEHPWTIVDMAMCRIRCEECQHELGGGPLTCAACQFAFGNLCWYDIDAGRQGAMTMNEHALRVGRYVIRHPHRYSRAIASAWRMLYSVYVDPVDRNTGLVHVSILPEICHTPRRSARIDLPNGDHRDTIIVRGV